MNIPKKRCFINGQSLNHFRLETIVGVLTKSLDQLVDRFETFSFDYLPDAGFDQIFFAIFQNDGGTFQNQFEEIPAGYIQPALKALSETDIILVVYSRLIGFDSLYAV